MFRKLALKARLMSAFRSGDLFLKYANTAIYPRIQDVDDGKERTTFVFTIPMGLDPAKVEKAFIFEQAFGPNVDLERENKVFRLIVYKHRLPNRYDYDYAAILPHISRFKLPIIAGMGRRGFEAYDMTANPHLLVAGETGSGKSTQLRVIMTTLVQCMSPERLHLYMADMKRAEFHVFKHVEHVQKVVTRSDELYAMLLELRAEMERRGDLLDAQAATHIDDLGQKLPYIVLCIDEVALLKKEKECMEIIEDISAIGRALGMFLILSMQRPDAQVLDGKLKNNLTVRMAFRHSDEINSRITIGSGEAADIKLKKRGRMIFKHEEMKEVQGPYLDLEEAKQILEPFRRTERQTVSEVEKAKEEPILGVLDE